MRGVCEQQIMVFLQFELNNFLKDYPLSFRDLIYTATIFYDFNTFWSDAKNIFSQES